MNRSLCFVLPQSRLFTVSLRVWSCLLIDEKNTCPALIWTSPRNENKVCHKVSLHFIGWDLQSNFDCNPKSLRSLALCRKHDNRYVMCQSEFSDLVVCSLLTTVIMLKKEWLNWMLWKSFPVTCDFPKTFWCISSFLILAVSLARSLPKCFLMLSEAVMNYTWFSPFRQ